MPPKQLPADTASGQRQAFCVSRSNPGDDRAIKKASIHRQSELSAKPPKEIDRSLCGRWSFASIQRKRRSSSSVHGLSCIGGSGTTAYSCCRSLNNSASMTKAAGYVWTAALCPGPIAGSKQTMRVGSPFHSVRFAATGMEGCVAQSHRTTHHQG